MTEAKGRTHPEYRPMQCRSCQTLRKRLHILEGWIRWERGEGPAGYMEKYEPKRWPEDYDLPG